MVYIKLVYRQNDITSQYPSGTNWGGGGQYPLSVIMEIFWRDIQYPLSAPMLMFWEDIQYPLNAPMVMF